jgi:hypothetical protein
MFGYYNAVSGNEILSALSLERLIYVSTATQASPSLQSVADIIGVSNRNNNRDEITGVLVIGAGVFLQVLEGARQDLVRALDRILADPRHKNLKTLDQSAIKQRAFAVWGMVGAPIKPKRQIVMDELIAFAEADPAFVIDRIQTMLAEDQTLIMAPA